MNIFRRKPHDEMEIVILRFAVGSMFLWFGIDKWVHPEAWYGWVPSWSWSLLLFSPEVFMILIGTAEFLIGICLVAGKRIRLASAVAGLILLTVVLTVGANDVMIRDSAALGGCLALFVHANAVSKKRLASKWIAYMVILYVILLFGTGIAYLGNAGVAA